MVTYMQSILQVFNLHPRAMIYVGAILLCILVRSQDITIVLKRKSQRTPNEQKKVDRGLGRSILLELLIYVPVSGTLVLLGVAPILTGPFSDQNSLQKGVTFNTLLGIASYGFPFASLRAIITKFALLTLSKYALLAHREIEQQLKGEVEKSFLSP